MELRVEKRVFRGFVSLEEKNGCLKPWRLNHAERLLFPSDANETLLDRAGFSAGVRLRFKTSSGSLSLGVLPASCERKFDLVNENNSLIESAVLPPGQGTVVFSPLPEGSKLLEIWLPHGAPAEIARIGIDEDAVLEPGEDARPRWVAYGSSITQCSAARSPAKTWPAIAARKHGLDLTCLGLGGQCHCEAMAGRMLRDLPGDVFTLKLGINVYGAASLSPRTFKPAVIGLISLLREKHPSEPVGLISPIISPSRENAPNTAGLTLGEIRQELADAFERIKQATGDKNLFFFDGRKLFGEELAGKHLPDGVHPDARGYEIMGKNAAEKVLPVLLRGNRV